MDVVVEGRPTSGRRTQSNSQYISACHYFAYCWTVTGVRTEAKDRRTGHGGVLERLVYRQRPGVVLERHIWRIGLLRRTVAIDDHLDRRMSIVIHDGEVEKGRR